MKREITIESVLEDKVMLRAVNQISGKSNHGGFNGMYPRELREYWARHGTFIKNQIRTCSYYPDPVERHFIVKPGSHKKREIGIYTVVDQAILTALNMVLLPVFDAKLSKNSFAFRPNKNCLMALQRAIDVMNGGCDYVIKTDIHKCFDTIRLDILMDILRREIKDARLLCLLERYLRVDLYWDLKIREKRRGVVQGSSLSPLLANLYLHELDTRLERKGILFVRYADDIMIFARDRKKVAWAFGQAKEILQSVLKMTFSQDKTEWCMRTEVTFLGYSIKRFKRHYELYVSDKAIEKMNRKSNSIEKMPFEEVIEWMGSYNRGWINYYQYAKEDQLRLLAEQIDVKQSVYLERLLNGLTDRERSFLLGYQYHFVTMTEWKRKVSTSRKTRKRW